MTEVTKQNIKEVLLIVLGLAVVILVFGYGFAQTGVIYVLSWIVFAGGIVGIGLGATGVIGSTLAFFRRKKDGV